MRASAALVTLALAASAPGVLAPAAAHADSIRDMQWALSAIDVDDSWAFAKRNNVTVAVLDTGVDPRHPDLAGRVLVGPDYTGHSTPEKSRYWARHGTSMASIIAGHGHGAGRADGVLGVAPQARILSIRVTWENKDPARRKKQYLDANKDAMARGIRYAVDQGASVINMSLGGGKTYYTGNAAEQAAISYALSKNVVLIASMGNDGAAQNRRNFPAAYPGVIAVGAVDRQLKPWKDSNRHEWISVAAPGVNIVSAQPGEAYATDDGTSASAAIVAGIAALIRSRYPKLTPTQVKQALEEGATNKPSSGRDTKVGAGVANALSALKAAHRMARNGNLAQPAPSASSAPAASASPVTAAEGVEDAHAEKSDTFIIAIIGCGAFLLLLGLVLAWRQRRSSASAASAAPVASASKTEPKPSGRIRPGGEVPRPPAPADSSPTVTVPDDDAALRRVDASAPLAAAAPDPHDDRYRPPWA